MTMPKHAARRDENEPELVKLARSLNWWLIKLHEPCDWLGCRNGRWYPIEIKTEHGDLTTKQVLFHQQARSNQAPILIWRDESDVFRDSGARRSA